jgi:hypothetical protein
VKDLADAFRLLEERQVGFEVRFAEDRATLKDISNANLQMMSEVRRSLDRIEGQYKETKLSAERAERIAKSRVSRHDLNDVKEDILSENGHKALEIQRNDLEKVNVQLRRELQSIIDANRKKEEAREAERRAEARRWKWAIIGAAASLLVAVLSGITVAVYTSSHVPPTAMHANK